jgi:glutathione reductase (NADPH)
VTFTGWELTPVAIAAARRLSDRLFGGLKEGRILYDRIPTVVFSHPPIGVVGMTEPDARKHYGDENIRTKQQTFTSEDYWLNPKDNNSRPQTAFKLVLAGEEEKVVGIHTMGPHCDEIIQGFSVAVKMGCTRRDLEATMAIHPTSGEELITFSGWGRDKDGKPWHNSDTAPKN